MIFTKHGGLYTNTYIHIYIYTSADICDTIYAAHISQRVPTCSKSMLENVVFQLAPLTIELNVAATALQELNESSRTGFMLRTRAAKGDIYICIYIYIYVYVCRSPCVATWFLCLSFCKWFCNVFLTYFYLRHTYNIYIYIYIYICCFKS
jgi:hypothetical protein